MKYLKHLPNLITLLRLFLLLPFFELLRYKEYPLAVFLLAVMGGLDALDGFLARALHATTRLGSILDPLVDKITIGLVMVFFCLVGLIPWWLLLLMIGRDVWILLGACAYHFYIGPFDFRASMWSKVNTALQLLWLLALGWELMNSGVPLVLITYLKVLVICSTVISMLHYTWVWGRSAYFHRQTGKHD